MRLKLPLRSTTEPADLEPYATRTVTEIPPYEIHSYEAGSGAEGIVLLHGLSGSARWWNRNIADLAERYRVVVPDIIGFGASLCPTPLPPLDEVAELIGEWIELMELQRVHLIGHSMGAQLAVHVAARRPDVVQRLVLVDAAGIPRDLRKRDMIRYAMEIAPVWRWGDPAFVPVIVGDAWRAGPAMLLQAIRHILTDDVRPLLPKIEAPTLIIWGELDALVPLSHAWELRGNIPGARLAVLRGAAHNPMVDRPEAFDRLLLNFLAGETVGR